MGHYCRICGRYRANEKVLRQGAQNSCLQRMCASPCQGRQFREDEDEIWGFLSQSTISQKNLAPLKVLAASSNSEIASMARLVMEIGKTHPRKKGLLHFLAKERRDLLAQLEETGLIYTCRRY